MRGKAKYVGPPLLSLLVLISTGCDRRQKPATGFSPLGYIVEAQPNDHEAGALALSESSGIVTGVTALQTVSTKVSAEHFPLFTVKSEQSEITATAQNSQHGIEEISIAITVGQMTDCSESRPFPSAVPCRTGASTVTKICEYADAPTIPAICKHTIDLQDGEMASYTAKAVSPVGPAASTIPITFSTSVPREDMVVPVWWHVAEPAGMRSRDRIAMGFFPDADYEADYEGFADDVGWTVLYSFFNEGMRFSRTYTLNRHLFDLWAAPFGADAESSEPSSGSLCKRSFPQDIGDAYGVLDGRLILHREDFRDCATLSTGGEGSLSAEHNKVDWLLVHESAHFLFGLGDEYPDGGHQSVSDPRNVFDTNAECEGARNAAATPPEVCVKLTTNPLPKWRIDEGNFETMAKPVFNSDFRDTSHRAVLNRLQRCRDGKCY